MSVPALHALLGVPVDIGSADLRLAYDRAMAMAVRMGDNRRALALSQAFDALPGSVRNQVYPAVQHRRAAIDTGPTRPARRSRRIGSSSIGGAGRGPRRRGRLAGLRRRTVVIVVLVALAVPAGVTVALHWNQWLKRPGQEPAAPQTSIVVQQVPATPVPTTATPTVPTGTIPSIPDAETEAPGGATANARRVPASTPVDANGLVRIVCQPAPGAAGYTRFARPGDVVSCTNGAVPQIFAPS